MISPSDKIVRFADIESLKTAIERDLITGEVNAQRYCVRFIMLNDFDTFRSLTSYLCKELNVQMYELQNLMLGDDKTITIDKLSNAIRGITQSSLVTPFSELVRFYKENDFNGFFNEIILTEDLNHPHKRIYIPIIGLNNRFNDFLKNFGRIEESAPIWQLYSSQDDKVKVFVSKFKSPKLPESSEYCNLETMKDWLDFWRKQAPRDKILCSAYPIRIGWKNSRPDSIFTFAEITNPHEFITDLLGVNIPFYYSEDEDGFWERILQIIVEVGEEGFLWKNYVENHFGTFKFSVAKILRIWADYKNSDFDRWLLKNYLLNTDALDDNPYLKDCIMAVTNYVIPESLFVVIAQRIFYASTESERQRFSDERRAVMREEKDLFNEMVPLSEQNWIMEQLIQYAQDEKGFPVVKKLITSTFDFERELYIGWYLKCSDDEFGLKHLKEFYPELHAYLSPTTAAIYRPGAEWLNDYFYEYRKAKVGDIYSESIRHFIESKNSSDSSFWDWYYKHNTCHDLYHELINDEYRRPDKVYWIDGLGAEFLPYIIYLIEASSTNYEVLDAEVATTGLPSNTTHNRFDVDGKSHIKIGNLDALAHGEHYKIRKTLIEELALLQKIVAKILRENSVGIHTIAIVSDHGLSALSRLCESKKLTGKAQHEGRYIEYSSDFDVNSMPEYITVNNPDDNKDYKIALTHSSLGNKPSHEVHGGCTPEEVLVPFIVISNNDASKPVQYEIKGATTDVPLSNPVFECIIVPKPKSVQIIVGGKRIPMSVKNTTWSAIIPNAVEGRCSIGILPFNGRTQYFDVNIFGLGMSESLFDDDF